MPHDDPASTDPMEVVGVRVPAAPGACEEMVRTFAEEYARLGWPTVRILATFRSPWYAAMHGAWLALGEERVRALVAEALGPRTPPSPGACGAEGGSRA